MYGKARPVENVLRFVWRVEKMFTVSGVVFGLLALGLVSPVVG